MPLIGAGVGVEYDHPVVAVAVGDEQLVRLGIEHRVGGAAEACRVVAGRTSRRVADLQQEPALPGELQHLPIGLSVAADPDGASGIDVDAVLAGEPIVALAGFAPGLYEVALRIEFDDGRRKDATLRPGRRERCPSLVLCQGTRALDGPDMVVSVHSDAGDLTEYSVVWERLRTKWVNLYPWRVRGTNASAKRKRQEREDE